MDNRAFTTLISFLEAVPAIGGQIAHGADEAGTWWVKFTIDVRHRLAWNTVQELGHVLNYLSVSERLPTAFKPVSPPPYLNGLPEDYLSWVIECADPAFHPGACAKWLIERLPSPVHEYNAWLGDDDGFDDGAL